MPERSADEARKSPEGLIPPRHRKRKKEKREPEKEREEETDYGKWGPHRLQDTRAVGCSIAHRPVAGFSSDPPPSVTSPSLIAALLLQMGRYRNAQYASEWILLVCLGEFSNKREFAWVNPVNKISSVARTVAHRFKEKKLSDTVI